MNILIIPGFTGSPEESTFQALGEELVKLGHKVHKIAWPHLPDDLDKYSISATLSHAREVIKNLPQDDLALLGFSMGGIVVTQLASEFQTKKLGLIVSPYQAGSDDDLAGKYREWKEKGYRIVDSSRYGILKIPFSFIEDARQYNSLETIKKVDCPALFVVAQDDDRVYLEASKKFFEAANEPKEWNLIPDMEHKYKNQKGMIEKVNKIIIDFLNGTTTNLSRTS